MKRVSIFGALALLVCAIPALAQVDVKERVRREVDRKQKLMREGKVIRTNVRVTVRLNNGSRLRGVVKQGRMIERHDGLEFVPSDVSADGAGVRLWYYDNTNSYIFLPFEQIKQHRIGERLTDDEVRQLGLEFDRKEREARERVRSRERDAEEEAETGDVPEVPVGETPEPGAGPAEDPKPGPSLTPEQEALLAEFPPEEGWGPIKKRDLELRKIQVDVYPNESEQKFLDNFTSWVEAFELRRELAQVKEKGDSPTPGPTPAPTPGQTPAPTPQPAPAPQPSPAPSPAPSGGGSR